MSNDGVVERIGVETDGLLYQEHVARYELARAHAAPGPLLDIASGTGYGSDLLRRAGHAPVVGVDTDRPALREARRAFAGDRMTFLAASGTAMPFREASFSTITSIETIEHIGDDRAFLAELARVLRPAGVCIVSTPNRSYSLRHGITNPFHVREYSEGEFVEILSEFFEDVQVFYQGFDARYHAETRRYAESIQARKAHLHPLLRWVVNHVYRPIRRLVPVSVVNFGIRRLLGLSYPQPQDADVAISPEPVQDCSNFVAICRGRAT